MIYADLIAAGIKTDHHETDLYAPNTAEVRAILAKYQVKAEPFTVQEGHPDAGQQWLDIPFAYTGG